MFFFILSLSAIMSLTAVAAEPTDISNERPVDIVDVHEIDPTIRVDMMYASKQNFVGRPIDGYRANICFLSKAAAETLKAAQARLAQLAAKRPGGGKLSLITKDCYRPRKSVKDFLRWIEIPDDQLMKKEFYPEISKADIRAKGYLAANSAHSRGSTIDLTIIETKADGRESLLEMGTPVDFFSEKSHTNSPDISAEAAQNRRLLLEAMGERFKNYSQEWWHFSLSDEPYPVKVFDFDVAK